MIDDWWKAPILQGPENDYGDYDYLIEELPHDYVKWQLTPYTCHCNSCGKERHLNFYSEHFFYCYDGWDSMDYTECWVCDLQGKINSIKRRFKLLVKRVKTFIELYNCKPKHFSTKEWWDFIKKVVK